MSEVYGTLISEAVAAGDLVETSSDLATEAGFCRPVLMTREAWADLVEWGPADQQRTGAVQDEDGRLWDVLYMACLAARRHRSEAGLLMVDLYRVAREVEAGVNPEVAQLATMMVCPVMEMGEDGVTQVIVVALPNQIGQGVLRYGDR